MRQIEWKILPVFALLVTGFVAPRVYAVNPADFDSFTGFDTFQATDFTIGPTGLNDSGPDNARFRDGFADQFLGGQFYESSVGAWLIDGVQTGVVDFENNNAASVAFVARSGPGDLVIRAFDDGDNPIGDEVRILGSNTAFEEVTFTGSIDRIELANLSPLVGGNSDLAAIDDFGFTTVPEPASMVVLGLGGLLVSRRRR